MKYKLFYQDQFPTTAICGPQQTSVIRTAKHMLAQSLQGTADARTILESTDSNRSIIQTSASPLKTCYTPFGFTQNTPTQRLPALFNGELLDVIATGYLLGNGHRTYSPVLMRFLSADRLSPFSLGGINAYAYCANDPINFSDPSGNVKSLATLAADTLKRFEIKPKDQFTLKLLNKYSSHAEPNPILEIVTEKEYLEMEYMTSSQLAIHANPSELKRNLASAISKRNARRYIENGGKFPLAMLREDRNRADLALARVKNKNVAFSTNMLKSVGGQTVKLPQDQKLAAATARAFASEAEHSFANLHTLATPPFQICRSDWIEHFYEIRKT